MTHCNANPTKKLVKRKPAANTQQLCQTIHPGRTPEPNHGTTGHLAAWSQVPKISGVHSRGKQAKTSKLLRDKTNKFPGKARRKESIDRRTS